MQCLGTQCLSQRNWQKNKPNKSWPARKPSNIQHPLSAKPKKGVFWTRVPSELMCMQIILLVEAKINSPQSSGEPWKLTRDLVGVLTSRLMTNAWGRIILDTTDGWQTNKVTVTSRISRHVHDNIYSGYQLNFRSHTMIFSWTSSFAAGLNCHHQLKCFSEGFILKV